MVMKTVNIHEAKTNLSKLVGEIENGGDDIVIARAGKPVARLTKPVREAKKKRHLMAGMWKDKIRIIGDIVSPMPEVWERSVAKYELSPLPKRTKRSRRNKKR
jgi:prevent-host-death family protein